MYSTYEEDHSHASIQAHNSQGASSIQAHTSTQVHTTMVHNQGRINQSMFRRARFYHLYRPIPLHNLILLWFIIKVGSISPGSEESGGIISWNEILRTLQIRIFCSFYYLKINQQGKCYKFIIHRICKPKVSCSPKNYHSPYPNLITF